MTEKLQDRLRAICGCNINSTPCMAEDECLLVLQAVAALTAAEAREAELRLLVEHAFKGGHAAGYYCASATLAPPDAHADWLLSDARLTLAETESK